MTQHPGQILREAFLEPLGINASALATGSGVNRSTISRLLAGKHPITPAMAARLGAFFQVPARWWLLMQAEYDAQEVSGKPELIKGVAPLEPDPDVLLTPSGVLRLAPAPPSEERPLSISRASLDALPEVPSRPAKRTVQTVQYENGAIALIGDGS